MGGTPVVACFSSANSTEYQLLFTLSNHNHYLLTVPQGSLVEREIPADFVEVRVLVEDIPVGVCYRNGSILRGVVTNKDHSACLVVDKSTPLWTFVYYGERRRISVYNYSEERVVITMPGKLPSLVAPPRRRKESSVFKDVVVGSGDGVGVKGCYKVEKGEVTRVVCYKQGGVTLECEDREDVVTITVRGGEG